MLLANSIQTSKTNKASTNLFKISLQRFIRRVKIIINDSEVIHAWLFS